MVRDAPTDEITTIKDAAIKGNDALVNITIGTTNRSNPVKTLNHMSGSRRGIMTKSDMHGRMGTDIRTGDALKSFPQAAPTLRTLPSQPEISISMEEMTGMNLLDNGDISNPLSPPWYTCVEQVSTPISWIPAAVKTSTSMVAAATDAAIFKGVAPCGKSEQLTFATYAKPLSPARPSNPVTWAIGTTLFDIDSVNVEHYENDATRNGHLTLIKIFNENQLADILTKAHKAVQWDMCIQGLLRIPLISSKDASAQEGEENSQG